MASDFKPTSSETPDSTPVAVERRLGSLKEVEAVWVVVEADGIVRAVEVQARNEAHRSLTEKISELLETEFDLTLAPGQLRVSWPTEELALTPWAGSTPESPDTPRVPDPRSRFLYRGRSVEPQGENKVTVRVVLEWDGDLYEGTVEVSTPVQKWTEATV